MPLFVSKPPPPRILCALAALPLGESRAFAAEAPGEADLFAVHGPHGVTVFRNACPHLGVKLDWVPGKFLSADGTRIICATHGAEFRLDTGQCLRGPCKGEVLTRVPCTIADGQVMVPAAPAARHR